MSSFFCRNFTPKNLLPLLLGSVSGILLFITDFPVHAWWLQIAAFLPWLWSLADRRPGWVVGALSGAALGLFYTGPLAFLLEFHFLMAAGLVLYLTFFWAVTGAAAGWFFCNTEKIPGKAVGAAIATACAGVLVEWLNVSLIPVWGTAQVFTRVWSVFPYAVQITSVTGVLGLVWFVFAVQALVVTLLLSGIRRKPGVIALVVIIVGFAGGNALLLPRKTLGEINVAAAGWTCKDLPDGRDTHWRTTWDEICKPLIDEAVAQGARLVVTPEVGFRIWEEDVVEDFLAVIKSEARKQQIFLVVGWFDHGGDKNRMVFIDDQGVVRGEYLKTHLIMGLENYTAGDGTLFVTDIEGFRLGGMICQDDNFTDLSRGYGRKKTHIVGVPTYDWEQVADYHFENSVFRGVESRYAIVRAALNGHSAIINARGEVLSRVNHFKQGPAVVTAVTKIYPPGSFYSRFGNWIAIPSLLWLLGVVVFRFRPQSSQGG